MITLFAVSLGKYQLAEMEQNYNISLNGRSEIFDKTAMLDLIMESIRDKINGIELSSDGFDPSLSTNWEDFDRENCREVTSIIVNIDGKFIYNGLSDEDADIVSLLPEYDSISDISVATYYIGGEGRYLIKPVPFTYGDGEFGTVYITGRVGHMLPEIKRLITEFIILSILLIIMMGGCLSVWIYRSILKPVNNLKDATMNITAGNLDFTLSYPKNDEFGQLYDAYEEMRVHLKQSIEENLKNDTESKELISNISHDLKTPITAIKGYVEGIMDGVADTPEKVDKYIKTIYNKANDMDMLIGELTLYSKIDTNKIPYNFVRLNVAEYFDDCIDEVSTELENSGFKLNYFNYTDKNTEVMADPEQIKRVINNIISNSLKYNDKEEGIINIRIKDQKDFVHFEIEDNGRGVSQEDLPYIFDRFYRTDTSRNSKRGGSGIGLSIVKKIIEAHGGTIWAFSTLETGLSIHFILKKADVKDDYSEYTQTQEVNKNVRKKDIDSRRRRKYRRT
jgi:signal transduction histidine kinase